MDCKDPLVEIAVESQVQERPRDAVEDLADSLGIVIVLNVSIENEHEQAHADKFAHQRQLEKNELAEHKLVCHEFRGMVLRYFWNNLYFLGVHEHQDQSG